MNTIRAIFRPEPDGTLRLPIPLELRSGPVKVEANLEAVENKTGRGKAGLWKDLPDGFWMAADFDSPLEDFREYME